MFMKRLFIAVPIQESVRNQIAKGVFEIEASKKMPVRWTPVQNLHLTLQFLGDVEEKRIPLLKQLLDQIKRPERQEELVFNGIGTFSNRNFLRIIWLGINTNAYLQIIQRSLTISLDEQGFETDHKKYKPHLTLGRVRDNTLVSNEILDSFETAWSRLQIRSSVLDRVTLFESRLYPGGPVYSAVYDKKLI